MGIFKAFLGNTYIKGETMLPKLRVALKNIKLFLGNILRYQMPISGATATCSTATYNRSTQTAQNISVVLSGQTLTNGTDYTVTSNSGGVNASSYTFTVSGINHFNSSVNGTFTINKKSVTPTVTLSQSEYTYNGNQCKPTPTVKDGSDTIPTSEYTVSYSNNINVGTATCTITNSSGGNYIINTVSKTFTIKKVTPTVTAPVAKSLTYNGSAQALATAGSTNWGTIQYCSTSGGTYSTAMISGTNAGSYDVWYKVVGNSNVNDVAPAKISVTIAKANTTYTAPTAKSLTYNTSAQALLNAGAVTGGTIQYSSDNSSWSTTIPTGTNAGTYTSYWRIVGDNNHNDKASASISTTIAKANGSVTTAPTAKSLTYNNTDLALVNAGSGTGTMYYNVNSGSYSTSIPTGKAAGTYTVGYYAAESSNYKQSTTGSVSVTINKVTPTVNAPTAKSLTYTGSPQALVNAGSTNWGTLQYSLDNSTWSTNIPNGTNATSYTVYYRVVGNSNINDVAAKSVNVSIAKANPTYTAPTKKTGLVYNGSAQNLLNAGSTSHGTIKYSSDNSTWSTTIPTGTNVGTYTAYWKLDGDSNHNSVGSTTISSISIAKVTPTVTAPTPKTLTFNNTNQTLANAGSTNWGTIQYCLNNSGGTYSTTVPSASAANTTYKVWYKVVGNSNINDVAPASIDCMIAEKRVTTPTITLDPSSYTYNNTARKPSVTVKDGSTVIPSSEYTVTYSNNTNAGTATVTISDNTAGNYYISGTTTFTISKVTPTVTAPKATTYSYNGSARDLVSGGSTNWGILQYSTSSAGTYSTTIPTQTNAGSYEVWYKVVGNSNINDVAPAKVSCSIAKATGSATVAGTSSTYNGSAKNLISVSNNTGTMHYKVDSGGWSTTLPQATNAGSWTIYYYMDASSNYTARGSESSPWGSVSSSIAKANGSVSTKPTAKSLTYNGSAQALVNGGSGTGTMMYFAGYDITIYTEPDGSKWRRISHQNNPASNIFASNSTFSTGVYMDSNRWFDVAYCNQLSSYELMIKQKAESSSTEEKYRWIQNYNPMTATFAQVASANVTKVTTAGYTSSSYGGLYLNAGSTYLSANNGTEGNWWGAVGCFTAYQGGIPGWNSVNIKSGYLDLYVRVTDANINNSWSTSVPTKTNAGTYVVAYKASASTNYNESASGSVSCSIAKVTPTVTAPTAKSLTYNGSAQALVNAGSTNWGTLKYSLDNSSYSTSIPSGTNATSYTVYYRVDGDTNINNVAAKSVSVSIAKANPTYTAPTAKSLTYTGSAQNLLNAGSTSHGTIQYSSNNSTWSTTIPTGTNAGTYTSYWKLVGDTNHNNVNSTSISTTIAQKAISIPTPTSVNRAYNGSAATATFGSATGAGITKYRYSTNNSSWTESTSNPSQTNVGTLYTQAYYSANNSNYSGAGWTSSATITISKASQSAPTATGATTTFHNTATATASGGGGQGTLTWTNGNTRTATGTTKTKAYWAGNSNYNASPESNEVSLVVNKATDQSVTVTTTNRTYNTSSQVVASATSHGCTYYLGFGSSSTSAPSSWGSANSSISQTNAGTYYVWYKGTADGNHSADIGATYKGTVTIAKADQSAPTATGATTTYNTTATATASGGGGVGSIEWSNGNTQTSVGSKTTKARWSGNSNYNASPWSNEVTVKMNKANQNAPTATVTTATYPGTSTASASGGGGVGTLTWTNGSSRTAIGTQTTKAYWAGNGNYNASSYSNEVTLSVAKFTPTVTLAATNRAYNGNPLYATASVATPSGGKTMKGTIYYGTSSGAQTYSVTYTGGSVNLSSVSVTNVGSATVYAYFVPDSTCNDVYNNSSNVSKTFSVSKAAMTYSAPKAAVRTYNGSAQQIVSGQSAGGGSIYYATSSAGASSSTTVPTQTNTGTTYSTYWKAVPDSNHSGGTSSWAQITRCTINKATLTITAKAQTVNYGTAITQGTGQTTTSGLVSGDALTAITLTQSTTNVTTTGTITPSAGATTKGISNYSVTYKTGTLTINKVAMSYTAPKVTTYTYANTTRALMSGGTATGGSIQYSTSQSGTYSTTVPTQTNAGTYTTWWKAVPDSNHSGGTNAASVSTTIAKAAGSVSTVPTAKNPDWTGSAQALVNAGSGTGTMMYKLGTGSWGTAIPTATNAGSYTVYYKASASTNYNESSSGSVSCSIRAYYNGHEFIEIGGVKWATMNIGANSVTDTGLHFQWGDTSGYTASQVGSGSGQKYFGWADYKYGNGTSSPGATGMTKYNSGDTKTVLDLSDDAARANWGGSWRMPTTAEFQALGNAVNTVWTADYQGSGVSGLVCTDKTDSSKVLFFPAAGHYGNGRVLNKDRGYYWSSSLNSSNMGSAYRLLFYSDGDAYWHYTDSRCGGFSVRGVVG